MSSVLITGCDRGLGLEFARQYAADGWRVYATCLDIERADDLRKLEGNVSIHALDVRDHSQIKFLAKELSGQPIDILLSNAGLGRKFPPFGKTDFDFWRDMLETNTLGPMCLAENFVEHVALSELKRMIFVSSRMGSIHNNLTGGGYGYRSSKAALNAVVKSMAIDLFRRGIMVLALHPGAINFPGDGGTVEAADSVAGMRSVVRRCSIHETGSFYAFTDTIIAW